MRQRKRELDVACQSALFTDGAFLDLTFQAEQDLPEEVPPVFAKGRHIHRRLRERQQNRQEESTDVGPDSSDKLEETLRRVPERTAKWECPSLPRLATTCESTGHHVLRFTRH